MIVAVTGSRYGPVTDIQAQSLKMVLKGLKGKNNVLQHNAEIGVVEEAVMLAHDLGYTCKAFPSTHEEFLSEVALMLSLEHCDSGHPTDNSERLVIVPESFNDTVITGPRIVAIWPNGSITGDVENNLSGV